MRILLVEDDKELSLILERHLRGEGYVIDRAANVEEARQKLHSGSAHPNLTILDLLLPDGDGVQLCRDMRQAGHENPVLMLSAKNSSSDRVTGLDSGADDYLPKPFSPRELSARVRALLRRQPLAHAGLVECGDLTIDIESKTVTIAQTPMHLMPKEFSLLEYLALRKNAVVRRDEILRNVWGVYSNSSSNRLEVYIRYLREKLEKSSDTLSIQTRRGLGYMLSESK